MSGDNEERMLTQVAGQAAHEAVRETFRLLGVDINEQDEINDFRADLVYARKMRRMSERAALAAFLAMFAAIGGGMVSVFWEGIKTALTGKH